MDSIVDKDEGKIQVDRMVSKNKQIQNLNDKCIELDRLADHNDEKGLVRRIRSNFHDLSKRIQTDLVHLVENKASKDEFAKLDNLIDTSGDLIEADLASIADSVQKEQKEANEALSALLPMSRLKELNRSTRLPLIWTK